MSYRRLTNRLLGWTKNQRLLALVFSGSIILLALPWIGPLFGSQGSIIGIPSSFFVMAIVTPILGICILSIFLTLVEDNDRHDPNLENE